MNSFALKCISQMSLKIFFFLLFSFVSFSSAKEIEIQEVVTSRGIKAWLIQDSSLPVISLNFSFQAGSAYDPAGKKGLASFLAALLTKGAGPLDFKAFQETLQDYAIELGFSADQDRLSGSLRTTLANKDKAFELLKWVLTAPRFDEDQVSKTKDLFHAMLLEAEKRPDYLVTRKLYQELFPNHPYQEMTSGRLKDIQTFTPADLKAFMKENLCLDSLIIGVCGDISASDLKNLLDNLFQGLPPKTPREALPDPKPTFDGNVHLIKTPHPQSSILFVQPSYKFTHPDFIKMVILDFVLGGSMESRLFQEIREKRGLAYSVSTSLSNLEKVGLWIGSAGTQNARVKESLETLKKEWTRVRDHGLTAQELKDAKTYLIGRFPLNFISTPKTAALLHSYQVLGFPKTYVNERTQKIQSVPLKDLNHFARDFLKPEFLTIVVAGQPEGLDAESLKTFPKS